MNDVRRKDRQVLLLGGVPSAACDERQLPHQPSRRARILALVGAVSCVFAGGCGGAVQPSAGAAAPDPSLGPALQDSTTLTIRNRVLPELLPLLGIELTGSRNSRRLDGRSFGEATSTRGAPTVRVAVPDTLEVRTAFVRIGPQPDTLATVDARFPVEPGRVYQLFVTMGKGRPYGFGVSDARAAEFRPGKALRAGDSLFVAWGYYRTNDSGVP
jgi:hypothetical protein